MIAGLRTQFERKDNAASTEATLITIQEAEMKSQLFNLRNSIVIALLTVTAAANAAPVLWVGDSSGKLGKVDVANGNVTVVGDMGVVMTDIAFDPSGHLFGISFSDLYSINPATAAATLVGNLKTTLNSLVFSSSGTLYGAIDSLYTINTSTGAATLVGQGGSPYSSSGDLAFVDGNLYLSSTIPASDTLIRLDAATGAGMSVGPIGVSSVFGLASNDNVNLYGVAGTGVYGINPVTGAGSLLLNYGGHGLGSANGTAFTSEAAVPEPETFAMMIAGLGALGFVAARNRKNRTLLSV